MTILLQPLIQLVKLGQPVFVKDSPEQQLRHMYLEILLRMPGTHEQVRNSAAELMNTAIQIIRVDNEENAVLAIKICVDVFRIHKAELQAHGQTFIDTILDMYKNMDGLVSETFGGGSSGSVASPVASASSPPKSTDGSSSTLLGPAMRSFRVMAECPIATIIFGQINFQLIEPILHVSLCFPTLKHHSGLDAYRLPSSCKLKLNRRKAPAKKQPLVEKHFSARLLPLRTRRCTPHL